jgi:hypothetical protein
MIWQIRLLILGAAVLLAGLAVKTGLFMHLLERGMPQVLTKSDGDARLLEPIPVTDAKLESLASGLSMCFSGALKDVTFVDAFPVLKQLLAAAQARGPITDPLVLQTIAALNNTAVVQGAKGRKVSGPFPGVVAPVSFNSAINYRFARDSKLKGWNVGISGYYNSDAVLRYLAPYSSPMALTIVCKSTGSHSASS